MLRRERGLGSLPGVLLFHSASVEEGELFFGKHWPEVPAISDPELFFFDAMGVRRGRIRELFGLRSLVVGAKALSRGVLPGRPRGDVFRMPGLFLVEGRDILWRQRFETLGDAPDLPGLRSFMKAHLEEHRSNAD